MSEEKKYRLPLAMRLVKFRCPELWCNKQWEVLMASTFYWQARRCERHAK